MERRSFVKNIFGSIIGFAVLPTALKEFAESTSTAMELPGVGGKVFKLKVRKGWFKMHDIVVTGDDYQFYMMSDTESVEILPEGSKREPLKLQLIVEDSPAPTIADEVKASFRYPDPRSAPYITDGGSVIRNASALPDKDHVLFLSSCSPVTVKLNPDYVDEFFDSHKSGLLTSMIHTK